MPAPDTSNANVAKVLRECAFRHSITGMTEEGYRPIYALADALEDEYRATFCVDCERPNSQCRCADALEQRDGPTWADWQSRTNRAFSAYLASRDPTDGSKAPVVDQRHIDAACRAFAPELAPSDD